MKAQVKHGVLGIIFLLIVFLSPVQGFSDIFLKDKMQQAKAGDYIVATINNCYNVLLVRNRSDDIMSIEEITIPAQKIQSGSQGWMGWKHWVESGAPGHTSWVMYKIHLPTGKMQEYYSYNNQSWGSVASADNFLSKLLSLRLTPIPKSDLKRIGARPSSETADGRRIWQPKMYFEGAPIEGVEFNAWGTVWPSDSSELSRKVIIVYLPKDDYSFPSYFPYWLQVRGWVGKANVRVVDSGRNMNSSQPLPPRY